MIRAAQFMFPKRIFPVEELMNKAVEDAPHRGTIQRVGGMFL